MLTGRVGLTLNASWQQAASNSSHDKEAAQRVLEFEVCSNFFFTYFILILSLVFNVLIFILAGLVCKSYFFKVWGLSQDHERQNFVEKSRARIHGV